MRKGKARIVIGLILIGLQILSMTGNAKLGNTTPLNLSTAFDAAFSLGYFSFGLIGLLLLVWGVVAFIRSKGRTDKDDDVYNYYHDKQDK